MVDSRNVPSENKNTARIEKNKTWWIFSHSPELIVPWGWNGFLAVATCCFQGNPNAGSATLKENKKEKDTLNGICVFISIIIIFLIYFLFIDLFFILSYIYKRCTKKCFQDCYFKHGATFEHIFLGGMYLTRITLSIFPNMNFSVTVKIVDWYVNAMTTQGPHDYARCVCQKWVDWLRRNPGLLLVSWTILLNTSNDNLIQ